MPWKKREMRRIVSHDVHDAGCDFFKEATSPLPNDNTVLNIRHWVHQMFQQRNSNLFQCWDKGKNIYFYWTNWEKYIICMEYSGKFKSNFALHPDFRIRMLISTVIAHKQCFLNFCGFASLFDIPTKIWKLSLEKFPHTYKLTKFYVKFQKAHELLVGKEHSDATADFCP